MTPKKKQAQWACFFFVIYAFFAVNRLGQTLNLNSSTSPSLTMYSLPSMR